KPKKIASVSDWIPIYRKLKKRKAKPQKKPSRLNEFLASRSFFFLRWPVLIMTFTWIGFLALVYLILRLYVAFVEHSVFWRGEKKRLRNTMRSSKTYAEWVENAQKLDACLGLDKWKQIPSFYYYDYRTIRKTIEQLRKYRNPQDVHKLSIVLQNCLKSNFAGTENPLLYSQTYYGTKAIIHEYNAEVITSIDYFTDSSEVSADEKRWLFKIYSKNFGRTALCLSGGACFAFMHFGIVKALLDADLLPKIVSGTSGGGLVAALTCCRTDEELRQLLIPELALKITSCGEPFRVWFLRWWKTGARFDAVDWARKCSWFTMGATTFQEAYERTGRILNISTVPSDPHSPVILCNDTTSPDCVIWSSLLASSAVPGILEPTLNPVANLDNLNPEADIVPFSFGTKWRDGSLRTDIPIESLNTYFNAKYSIVSQVNPHISLFFYAPRGSVGRPVSRGIRIKNYGNPGKETGEGDPTGDLISSLRGGFVSVALENLVKLDITKWLKFIKSLDLLPHLMKQDWSNIWLQNFTGTVTLWPKVNLGDFPYILSDPSPERLQLMIERGERSAWPKLLFIKHRLGIERAIERGREATR
ncbi:hypothetical protein BABINDRAFT_22396, partial [Babjeviella inositovora NRRL Y-12698]